MADVNITADIIIISLTPKTSVVSHYPAAVRNPDLDQTFDLKWNPVDPDDVDPGAIYITVTGTWFNIGVEATPPEITVTPVGSAVYGGVWSSNDVPTITLSIPADYSDLILEQLRKNWVKWSTIGSLDFTIDRSNVAGERPMDWKGWIYAIKKLAGKVVVYGENGISFLLPAERAWGLQTVNRIGIKNQTAVTGTEFVHWFIDKKGDLCELSEGIKVIGYSEYLDSLISPVLSYNPEDNLVYICDGAVGYVYSPSNESLGKCYTDITGAGTQSGILYVTSQGEISTQACNLCTDIYDFGTRKPKSVHSVELGTDLTQILSVAMDYRRHKHQAFSTTNWYSVNMMGKAYVSCYGSEFRVRVKSAAYEYFELDYITVNGEVHDS